MLFYILVALLACSVLPNNSSLHFPEFVKMYPKQLNVAVLSSNFVVCIKLPVFGHSVLRICTFEPRKRYEFHFNSYKIIPF